MKTDTNKTLFYLALALFIACLVCRAEGGGDCSEGRRCNATIGERVAADGEEFLMESEISRRILATKPGSYTALKQQKPFCNSNVYGSCIGQSKISTRPCNYQNKCSRL